MKSALGWFKEKGFTFDDKITIKDVIELQEDARKTGFMQAQNIASDIIRQEAPKYAAGGEIIHEFTLSGLSYKVVSAILAEGDKLNYLP